MDHNTSPFSPEDRDLPVRDDEAVLVRARNLIRCGYVRRMWLLLFDDDGVQLRLLPQIECAPISPDAETGSGLRGMLEQLAQYAAEVAFVLERPGSPEPEPDDLAWAEAIARAAQGAPLRLRGVLLAHGTGVDRLEAPRILAA